MDDAQFEALLANAYRRPVERPEPVDLVEGVLARAHQRRRMRRTVLALATLVGVGLAAAAFAATGVGIVVADQIASLRPEPLSLAPSIWWVVGFVLILCAAVRNAIRDL
ncbi:hypothetical protein [Phenylobacterium sp.]|jgi:hypothetical protein|uniref:hypothetical protein n=1 Tax=Phenylobacterium sp. TaxID=1871053 RepID=UPI002F422140